MHNQLLSTFLDGVMGAVVGLLAIAGIGLLKIALVDMYGVALFLLALGALYIFSHQLINVALVLAAAVTGQVLYINH